MSPGAFSLSPVSAGTPIPRPAASSLSFCTWKRPEYLKSSLEYKNLSYGQIIRIYHECEGRIEKYVPRIAVLASRGLLSDDKQ